jgi:hypothetical protein
MGAHEDILTALQRLFTKAGYRTDRKNVPLSRGPKKADLLIKDFQLGGVRNVIIDVTLRHDFHGSCANLQRNGEPSHPDVNGALVAVKEKLDNYQHDYSERNIFFLPAVMTTSGRISGDFLLLPYILSHCQTANYFTRMGILDTSFQAYKQCRGSYFCYNRAAIGIACAQATAMRIDIAPHKRPRKKPSNHVPDPHHFHFPPLAHLTSNIRLLDYIRVYVLAYFVRGSRPLAPPPGGTTGLGEDLYHVGPGVQFPSMEPSRSPHGHGDE